MRPKSSTPALVLFGAGGQLGRAAQELTLPAGWRRLAFNRSQVDITDSTAIDSALDGVEAGLVFNAAAYTAVDKAENERDQAFLINGRAAGLIAEASARRGLAMVHVSTDFVFDGTRTEAYLESDATNPLSVYGASKLAGEQSVAAANPRSAILRAAWVFSPHAACFPRAIFRALRTKAEVRVVEDQRGCPTPADGLAEAVFAMAPALTEAPAGDPRFGLFHLCGDEPVSRFEFAMAVAAEAKAQGLSVGNLVPCPTDPNSAGSGVALARRPANAVLSCAKLKEVHGIAPPSWRTTLPACIKRYEEEL